MSGNRRAVRPGPDDDWDNFRPQRDLETVRRNHSQRLVPILLVLATVLFIALMTAWWLRPHIHGAVDDVAKAIRAFSQPELPSKAKKRPQNQSVIRSRKRRHRVSGPSHGRATELGPFDAYVLNGDRYIRVEGMATYALLDTRTGDIIWIREPR